MDNQCEHGQLARQCPICERDEWRTEAERVLAEWDKTRSELDEIRAENERIDEAYRGGVVEIERLRAELSKANSYSDELFARLQDEAAFAHKAGRETVRLKGVLGQVETIIKAAKDNE